MTGLCVEPHPGGLSLPQCVPAAAARPAGGRAAPRAGGSTLESDKPTSSLRPPLTSLPRPGQVWLYGGGFITGSGVETEYGPQHWLDRGLMVVTGKTVTV